MHGTQKKPAKPTLGDIRARLPISQYKARGTDPIRVCNLCGLAAEQLSAWREHDEHDRPLEGPGRLVFIGVGAEHGACREHLDKHPRLYAEVTGLPGTFPRLCGDCPNRKGFACSHPNLKANGGPGLKVELDNAWAANAIICGRGGRIRPVHHALKCEGKP